MNKRDISELPIATKRECSVSRSGNADRTGKSGCISGETEEASPSEVEGEVCPSSFGYLCNNDVISD